ncbi:methyl-CpG-binding domain-containing protein 13-like [Coffea eugenioides]|uniref:methyl-CpG-binding domain-containing protein 13-like n=1 Tax=Coffea eugenioides TaxID=49369 RepID=UPI000F604F1D|nr:methyl-CpG-binding domain-containing protein 13-like [Coffea eugenioides]
MNKENAEIYTAELSSSDGSTEKSSDDWLPAGWKVDVRVRKTGKKDKCYVDPSNERKFYSKPEVLRYLKDVRVSQPVHEETQNKSISSRPAIKEEAVEGLPAGWIKETRVTQKGNKIRRDPYYIDPESGHLFRSMKEVFRYLDTGKMVGLASKANEQSSINLESRDNSLPSSVEIEEKRTADSKAEKQFIGNEIQKSETAAIDNDNLPEANKLKEREKKESSSESTTVTEVLVENSHTGIGLQATNRKKRKLNDKKGADLPRRTSKRLAGVRVNLSLESNSHTRVRRAAGRQMTETEVNCADKGDNLADVQEQVERVTTGTEAADSKQDSVDALPPRDVTFPEELVKLGVADCKGDEKPEAPLGICLKDLCQDPCIEFAIKTLMGAIPIGDETKVSMNQGSSSNLPDAVPGSCMDSPSKDIWSDPCFEFAVKTLTGEIDTNMETIQRQPPHNSSETIESGLTNNSMSAGVSHASVSSRHSSVAEFPVHKQRL